MKKMLFVLIFAVPMFVYSAIPPSITALEVSLIDANGKVVKKASFNPAGRLSLPGVDDAVYTLEVKNTKTNKKITIGKKPNDRVRIDKSTPLLMKVSLADYQDGDDLVLRKRPGRSHGGSSGLATGKRQHKPLTTTKELDKSSTKSAANHNTTRSNRTASSDALDPDSDNDGIDDDCDGIVFDISNKRNKIEILARCDK